MSDPSLPGVLTRPLAARYDALAADTLRRLALDEELKARVAADPKLSGVAWRVARRYVCGRTLPEALARVRLAAGRGHRTTVDFMGESTRDATVAEAATTEFLRLAAAISTESLTCSISLDLSHIGSVIDRELGLSNAARIAEATAATGVEFILSAEGHDRTDQVLDDHQALCERFDHVGVTVQARLHRTPDDLERLLARPGRIRLVKGSFDTPLDVAYAPDDSAMLARFDALATRLLRNRHPCSIATHDVERLEHIDALVRAESLDDAPYIIEVLDVPGARQIEQMRDRGHATQIYFVYGTEWWLYVCNRLAEDPQRLHLALVDAVTPVVDTGGNRLSQF